MSKPPSERELHRVARDLKSCKPGAQKAVGEGIYMRLDRGGRRRFQFRVRTANRSHPGGTYDTWEEAQEAREQQRLERPRLSTGEPTVEEILNWTIEEYAKRAWWPTVIETCGDLTLPNYRHALVVLLPLVRGITLAQLMASPLLLDQLRRDVKALKTYPAGHKHEGELAPAAADRVIAALRMICTHAVERRIIPYNPVAGVKRFNQPRTAATDGGAPSHRKIMPSEVKHPNTLALVGTGMRGDPLTIARRRLMPELIATGMRPSDILAMRYRWSRDENGPLRHLHIGAAVKDLAGHLLEGEPKTGERDIYLFDAIAERVEFIYQLAGCPDLDTLVFPNREGGLLGWGNWRTHVWYPALRRAGIIKKASADAPGAFVPYTLRHVGVTIMLHATRHDTGTGNYSEREVARQFGHTVATLDRVYADIPKDMHGIAGLTMDEILRGARRKVWGPMPGDSDYEPVEHDLIQVAELTGIDRKALAARIQRGSFPAIKRRGKYYVTEFDLAWCGLLAPSGLA